VWPEVDCLTIMPNPGRPTCSLARPTRPLLHRCLRGRERAIGPPDQGGPAHPLRPDADDAGRPPAVACGASTERQRPPAGGLLSANVKTALRDSGSGRRSFPAGRRRSRFQRPSPGSPRLPPAPPGPSSQSTAARSPGGANLTRQTSTSTPRIPRRVGSAPRPLPANRSGTNSTGRLTRG
jgi:hypothetical protein